jgi:hypothetical protein
MKLVQENTREIFVIAMSIDFAHCQEFQTTFQKLYFFPSSGEGRETPTLLGPLEKELTSITAPPKIQSF